MTEYISILQGYIDHLEYMNKFAYGFFDREQANKDIEAFKAAIKALEQEPNDFARWVAREIFDDEWEYNKDAFAEIACRKLAKLGIVRANGDEWELVEQEPITERIEYGTDGNPYVLSMTNGKVEPQESEDMGDYPDAIPNQFDNMTGSMNL